MTFSIANVHPGLKKAIDNEDVKTAKNLIKKIGVKDIYCPANLSYDVALQLYGNVWLEEPSKMWEICDSAFVKKAELFMCKTHVQLCKELLKRKKFDTWEPFFKDIKASKLNEQKENHPVLELKQENISQSECFRRLEDEQVSSSYSLALLHNIFCESNGVTATSNYECMLFYNTVLDSVKKYNLKMERICKSNKPLWPQKVSVEKKNYS